MKTSLCVTSLTLLLTASAVVCAPLPDGPLPHPVSRPKDFQPAAVPVPEITGSIPRATVPQDADASLSLLKQGLDSLSNRDISSALAARDALPPVRLIIIFSPGRLQRRVLAASPPPRSPKPNGN